MDLNLVRREGGHYRLDLSTIDESSGFPFRVRCLHGYLEVEQSEFTKFGVLVDGTVEVEVPCDRCGDLYWQKVELDFAETFVLGKEPEPEPGERQLTEEDVATFYFPNGRVDVVELLSEYIVSSLPERMVCRSDCPGPKELIDELGFVDLILHEGGAN